MRKKGLFLFRLENHLVSLVFGFDCVLSSRVNNYMLKALNHLANPSLL